MFKDNTQVTTFYECFYSCKGLTSIPSGIFKNNTKATNFEGCFRECNKLVLIEEIFPDPGTNNNFFVGRKMNFKNCFYNVGTQAASPGTAPKLWLFNKGGLTWTTAGCFTGANVTGRDQIPATWGGDLAGV